MIAGDPQLALGEGGNPTDLAGLLDDEWREAGLVGNESTDKSPDASADADEVVLLVPGCHWSAPPHPD
jgi:hypothetical protein